eukprot:TRINITY_DN4140_c0_g1_i1.p1 TRINITY_DN4140_c0_g1~~TRINITY_DN4140_c0_g1_i1.p1  ORF type:complete len:424 (+),score=113.49 TRINITY_DN4140_c0_g1_i1:104-1375(+)
MSKATISSPSSSSTSVSLPQRRTLTVVQPSDVSLFTIMDDITDKLKLLDYETKFCTENNLKPLGRFYFAFPSKSSADQFSYLSSLVNWLLKEVGADFISWGDEFDDPSKICNTISEQLRKLGMDVAPTKLRYGYGESVCCALNFLLDKVLAIKRWKPQPVLHKSTTLNDEVITDDQAASILGKDQIEEEVTADQTDESASYYSMARNTTEEKGEEKTTQPIIEAKSNVKDWAEEIERMRSKLKFKSDAPSKEWRTHIDQGSKHSKLLLEVFPNCKTALSKIDTNLKKAIERIKSKEKHMNKEFDNLGSEFKDKQKKHDALQEQHAALSREVNDLHNQLQGKAESIERIKEEMREKNNEMTDTSSLRKIQTALTSLKTEIGQMELRIGIVNQTLLQSKLKAARQASMQNPSKSSSSSVLESEHI